jgi:CDP-glycerol glycerophosphotransferase (TagB/SpsB family)
MLPWAVPPVGSRVVVDRIDIQDALADARVLVTDYSGVAWDMLSLRRPVVFFAPDLQRVERSRGLHIDLKNDPPGRFADDVDEAIVALDAALTPGLDAAGDRWRTRAMAFDDGESCARTFHAILRRLNNAQLSRHA